MGGVLGRERWNWFGCSTSVVGCARCSCAAALNLGSAIESCRGSSRCCVFAFDLGCSENSHRTATGWSRTWRRNQCAGPDCGIENRSGDANLAREIAGEGKVVTGIGYDFDDGPQCCVGADRETNVSGTTSRSSRGEFSGSTIGEKSDDEEYCEEESSGHEHHETKSRTTARRGGGSSSAMFGGRVCCRALALRVAD